LLLTLSLTRLLLTLTLTRLHRTSTLTLTPTLTLTLTLTPTLSPTLSLTPTLTPTPNPNPMGPQRAQHSYLPPGSPLLPSLGWGPTHRVLVPTSRSSELVRGGSGALYRLDVRRVRPRGGDSKRVRNCLRWGTAAVEHFTTQSPSTFRAQKRPGLNMGRAEPEPEPEPEPKPEPKPKPKPKPKPSWFRLLPQRPVSGHDVHLPDVPHHPNDHGIES